MSVFLIVLAALPRSGQAISKKFAIDETYAYTSIYRNDGIDIEAVQELIDQKKPANVEDFLSEIKRIYPEYFKQYILMYRSRSLQGSSFQEPRALVFGYSAKLVMSFNGSNRQRGGDRVEFLQFLPDTNSFELRELSFENATPKLSKANPPRCIKCHQSPQRQEVDPRPNWEPYNVWLGAYGGIRESFDEVPSETITRFETHKYDKDLRKYVVTGGEKVVIEEQALEKEQLDIFEKNKASHPRYKHLGEFDLGSLHHPGHLVLFSEALGTLNFRRMWRLIRQNPKVYEKYKYPLLHLLAKDRMELPSKVQDWHRKKVGFPMQVYIPSPPPGYGFNPGPPRNRPKTRFRTPFMQAIEFVFQGLGYDTSDWSTDFKTQGRYAFSDRLSLPGHRVKSLLRILNEIDPELVATDDIQIKAKIDDAFETMTFEEWQSLSQSQPDKTEQPLQQHCARCHESGAPFPYIPFTKKEELKAALKKKGYPRGSLLQEIIYRTGPHATIDKTMPPNVIISRDRREKFIQYLKNL